MGKGIQHASGGRLRAFYGQQPDTGTPVAPDKLMLVAFPEEITVNFNFEESDEPSGNLDVVDLIESFRDAGGTFNYRLRTQSMGMIYKPALGGDIDVVSIEKANGNVRTELFEDYTSGSLALECTYIPNTFNPAGGRLAIPVRTNGNTDEQLIGNLIDIEYVSHDNLTFTLAAPLPAPYDAYAMIEDCVFQYEDSGAGDDFSDVWTHLNLAGKALPIYSSYGLLRDIVYAIYYDSKVTQLEERFPKREKIQGSFQILAGSEFWTCRLAEDAEIGDTTITIQDRGNDRRDMDLFFTPGRTFLWIDKESYILSTAFDDTTGIISGIPPSGVESIEQDHLMEPVAPHVALMTAPQITRAILDSPLATKRATCYLQPYGLQGFPIDVLRIHGFQIQIVYNHDTEKVFMGEDGRAAIPDGGRVVTMTLNLEFDNPLDAGRVRAGEYWRIECRATDIDRYVTTASQIRPTNDWCIRRGKFTSGTPTAQTNTTMYYDITAQATSGLREAFGYKVIVNDQPDYMASN